MHFMGTATEALFYYRISLDPTGERLGVDRQEPPCLAKCKELGFTPGRAYVDNDLSATTGVTRPDFEQLLTDLKANPRPVIVWHLDRLLRLSSDLERVIETGVNVYSVHAGYFDLSTPAGRAVARTVTAWAQYEGEQKALRQIESAKQRASMGKSWWSSRPFGFDMDGTHREPEAAALRQAYDDLLTGKPLSSIAASLNERGLLTNKGNRWTAMTFRSILLNARNAGIRCYRGEEVGAASWAPIVPEETYRAACYLLNSDSRKSGGGGPRRYLLSGLVDCGRCGAKVRGAWRGVKDNPRAYAVYSCRSGHVSARMDHLDRYVERLILNLLSSESGAAFWHVDADGDHDGLHAEAVTLRARLDELAESFAEGEITRPQLQKGSSRLRERLSDVEGRMARAVAPQGLGGAASASDAVRAWDSFDTDAKRVFIEALAERICVHVRPKGTRVFREGDIEVEWKSQTGSR